MRDKDPRDVTIIEEPCGNNKYELSVSWVFFTFFSSSCFESVELALFHNCNLKYPQTLNATSAASKALKISRTIDAVFCSSHSQPGALLPFWTTIPIISQPAKVMKRKQFWFETADQPAKSILVSVMG